MKNVTFSLLFLATLSACNKDAAKLPQADFELRLSKTDSISGVNVLYVDKAINVDGTAFAAATYHAKQNTVELSMGILPVTSVVPRLKAVFVFKQCSDPSKLNGSFNLPADSNKLDLKFTEFIDKTTIIHNRFTQGKIEIEFDSSTRKLKGIISNFKFNHISGRKNYNLILNGWFNHAGVE